MGRGLVIGSRRLCAAADFLLEILESPEGRSTIIDVDDGGEEDDAGSPKRAFTRTELVEAMAMLVRMGCTEQESWPE